MLSFWRKQSTIVVHLVFWPIIAVFVIWGFERAGSAVGGAAAVVNDHPITITQYRNALQQMIDTYSRYMGGNFDENMQRQFRVKEAAMNQLVGMELISEEAEKMGLQVTDTEVRDQLINNPYLQKEGRFNKEYYDIVLRNRHQTATQFEDEMKKDLLRSKTDRLFERQLKPSPLEVEKEKALRAVKMNVAFLTINKTELAEKMNISNAQVKDYLKDSAHEAEVKKYFENHRSEFTKAEEVKASHILIKAAKGNSAEENAARAKLAKAQEELKTKTFADVAKKYSDDPGSKEKGGDLGWFAHDTKVREFADAAFAQEPGKVGPPVQSIFGFHLIKVEAKHPPVVATYDTAKETIAKKMFAEDRIEKTIQEAEKNISSKPEEAFKELQSLDNSVKWQETGFFTAADDMIPKIGDSEELALAATSLSSQKPVYPGLVKTEKGIYVLKLVKEEKVPATVTETKETGKADGKGPNEKVVDEVGKDFGRTVFGTWAGSLRNNAKVSINNQVVTGMEEPGE